MRKSGLETAWSTEAHYDSCTAFQGDSRIGGMVAITSMRSAVSPGGARPFEDVRDSFPTPPHSHGISVRQDFGYGKIQAFEIAPFGLAGVTITPCPAVLSQGAHTHRLRLPPEPVRVVGHGWLAVGCEPQPDCVRQPGKSFCCNCLPVQKEVSLPSIDN